MIVNRIDGTKIKPKKDIVGWLLGMPTTVFVKDCLWKSAGLSIQIDENSTRESIQEGIKIHDLVVGFLKKHSGECDFDKKYLYSNGHVKYYQVLDLAEKEAA